MINAKVLRGIYEGLGYYAAITKINMYIIWEYGRRNSKGKEFYVSVKSSIRKRLERSMSREVP